MIQYLRNRYTEFHATFHDSEVILWARAQFLFLAIYTALQGVDMSEFISDRHLFQIYLFVNGVVGEYARRRREDWSGDAQ